jgi:hypothetical protein
MRLDPNVRVRIGASTFSGTARILDGGVPPDEDGLARQLVLAKYESEDDLDEWGRTSLVVAIDLTGVTRPS